MLGKRHQVEGRRDVWGLRITIVTPFEACDPLSLSNHGDVGAEAMPEEAAGVIRKGAVKSNATVSLTDQLLGFLGELGQRIESAILVEILSYREEARPPIARADPWPRDVRPRVIVWGISMLCFSPTRVSPLADPVEWLWMAILRQEASASKELVDGCQ
jgi:hypothetical protein